MRRAITVLLAALGLVSSAGGETPMNLTQGSEWQYRLVDADGAGEWTDSLAKAAGQADVPESSAVWPGKWRTFVAWEPNQTTVRSTAAAKQDEVPVTLTLGGISACRATLPLYTGGVLDLTVGHGAPGKGRWAWVFGSLSVKKDEQATLAVESAGPVTVWVAGQRVLQADKPGEHRTPITLKKGSHVVSARVESGRRWWYFKGRILPPGKLPVIQARCTFEVKKAARFASLTATGATPALAELNGKSLRRPLPAMIGPHCRGIRSDWLKPGRNVLTRKIPLPLARTWLDTKRDAALTLTGLTGQDARVLMGPVVTIGPKGKLSIRAITDANVPAELTINGKRLRSSPGLHHRWALDGLKPATSYPYTVQAGDGLTVKATLRTPPAGDKPVTVALVGDPQSGKAWKTVAASLQKSRPDVLIIAGDVVVDGLVERQWLETFLAPAEGLLATMPVAVVPGNHDRYSPLMEALLGYGGEGPHWSFELGGGMLVGIDGGEDFRAKSPSTRWLNRTLKGARGKRVFVVSHYPAYSSRNHGKLATDGRVLEWTTRVARNRIVGVLERHGVEALFGGHDHGYERSELPSGLSAIVTGGGGAGPYPKRDDAAKQNPYSKSFAVKHHTSLLRIGPDQATLRVLSPAGELIDKRTFPKEAQQEK